MFVTLQQTVVVGPPGVARYVSSTLRETFGLDARVGEEEEEVASNLSSNSSSILTLTLDPSFPGGNEGFELTISAVNEELPQLVEIQAEDGFTLIERSPARAQVCITSLSASGLLNGFHRLAQLIASSHPLGPAVRHLYELAAHQSARRFVRHSALASLPLPDPSPSLPLAARALIDWVDLPPFYRDLDLLRRFEEAGDGQGERPRGGEPAVSSFMKINLPVCKVSESPRYGWRGALIDVARHFLPLPDLLHCVDLLALLRLNRLHLHLVDDQGWRLEVPALPRLTEVGAWRVAQKGGVYGGFYSEADIRVLVQYAAERGVTVVPELEIPGHSLAALVSCPDLIACEGNQAARGPVPTAFGVLPGSALCSRDSALGFIEEVLDRVCALFPSQWVHIGGDEVEPDTWAGCSFCRDRLAQLGLSEPRDLQGFFVRHACAYLAAKGRSAIGWDDVLECEVPPALTVMHWRDGPLPSGPSSAPVRRKVISTTLGKVYLDHRQTLGPGPGTWYATLGLETVGSFDPSADLEGAGEVLGGQGNIWSEYIPSLQQFEYSALPRLASIAHTLFYGAPSSSTGAYLNEELWALAKLRYCPAWQGGVRGSAPVQMPLEHG